MLRRLTALLILGVAVSLTSLAKAQIPEDDWRFSLEASWWYGPVDGYVQTPSGGEPGTSSNKRPTLDEIGIDETSIYDAQAIIAHGDDELYLGGQFIQMSGSATLDQTLISQGDTFPAGTHVSSEVDFDWYRFGYRRRFILGKEKDWTLTPGIGVAVLDFSYKLKSSTESVNRSYIKLNAQFGLETEWRPGCGPFSVNLRFLGTVPVAPPLPQMFVEELVATYRVLDRQKCDLSIFAGVAFEQIWYEDDQSQPNHFNADFGPMAVVGLNFSF